MTMKMKMKKKTVISITLISVALLFGLCLPTFASDYLVSNFDMQAVAVDSIPDSDSTIDCYNDLSLTLVEVHLNLLTTFMNNFEDISEEECDKILLPSREIITSLRKMVENDPDILECYPNVLDITDEYEDMLIGYSDEENDVLVDEDVVLVDEVQKVDE